MSNRAGRCYTATAVFVIAACCAGCNTLTNSSQVVLDDEFNTPRAERLNRRAAKLIEQGKLPAATAALEEAIVADQTYGPAHNNLGLIQLQQRDLYSAAWSFQRAKELMPERGEPANNLGLVMEQGDRFQEAIAAYGEANEIDPKNPEFLGNLIRARIRAGDRDESLPLQLGHLIFLDSRPEWVRWARENLARELASTSSDGPIDVEPSRMRVSDEEEISPGQPNAGPELNRPEALIEGR